MNMPRSRALVTACAAVSALAASAATAGAATNPYAGSQSAKFKATLSGSQVTTWEYHHKLADGDHCGAPSDGYGDQTIKFDAKKQLTVTFLRPPKGNANVFGSAGRPLVATLPALNTVTAHVDRNGDYKVDYAAADHSGCSGDNGGGADSTPEPPDCGERTGRFGTRLYFHDPSESDDLVVPFPEAKRPPERNHLALEGWNYLYVDPHDGSAPATVDETYRNCPLLLPGGYVEKAGNIFTSRAKVAEGQLFDKRRKRIVISGSTIQSRSEGDYSGKTIIAWNLRLTRVR